MRRGAAAALGLLAAVSAGCGGGGKLAWQGQPAVYIPARIPGDRILSATVRNSGSKPIVVQASRIKLLDGQGRGVRASAQFIRTFGHGLIFPDQKPRDEQPLVEQRRIGVQLLLRPGRTAPLIVSWHQPAGAPPVKLDYGAGTLPLPPPSAARRARG